MSQILDTDHCVAILRGVLDISSFVSPETQFHITATTVGELVYGAFKSVQSERNLEQIHVLIRGVTVLPFDEAPAFLFGKIKDELRRQGTPIAEPDLQIASIALHHELPLVTHNQRHFNRVPGLILQDWL